MIVKRQHVKIRGMQLIKTKGKLTALNTSTEKKTRNFNELSSCLTMGEEHMKSKESKE